MWLGSEGQGRAEGPRPKLHTAVNEPEQNDQFWGAEFHGKNRLLLKWWPFEGGGQARFCCKAVSELKVRVTQAGVWVMPPREAGGMILETFPRRGRKEHPGSPSFSEAQT